MRFNYKLTIGNGLENFINAKELYLVVCLNNGNVFFNPWATDVIVVLPSHFEFHHDKTGCDLLLKEHFGLDIKEYALFTDLREAKIFRTQKGFEALEYASRLIQLSKQDWQRANAEFMDDIIMSNIIDTVIATDKKHVAKKG